MEDMKKEKAQRTKESLKEGKDRVVKEKMASKRPYFMLLAISIVSEVIATVSLKESEAFTVLGPSIVVVICYGIAISLLVVILRHLPLGLVYGIWGGIGTAATMIVGMIIWNDPFTPIMGVAVVLIVGGVYLLNKGTDEIEHKRAQEERL